jgi:ribonuclease HIII
VCPLYFSAFYSEEMIMAETKNTPRSVALSPEQADKLRGILDERCWTFKEAPHARWRAEKEKTVLIMYLKGTLVIQGKGAEDFIQFILEPEILGACPFTHPEGGVTSGGEKESVAPFEPHAGIDESGKGDFFGPMVISCVYVADAETDGRLKAAGVKDSKLVSSDGMICLLAEKIRYITKGSFAMVRIGPPSYNRMYENMHNLNRMLAWGHARALENLLEKRPDCGKAVSDKFGDESLILRALMERGRKIELTQRTKAESDTAVAAASILAREGFITGLKALSEETGATLPRGAGPAVLETAADIASSRGEDALRAVCKTHFNVFAKALSAKL